ncbi:MAG: MFS transporter [Methanothermobacter sp.]|jgi:EmrB/QacA subfamily drug resistance transporter|nr:MFS transporter [Candidatus Bipolaricaulota bacterium]MDX9693726.1 MFS transporter [Methanothermobacter sp.]
MERSLKLYVLLAATLSSFLTPFMGSSINLALPVIGREFQIDAILQTWIPTAYLLAAAMFAVPFGRLSEIKGMKKIFVYGNIIFFISSLLSALSPNAIYLIIFRLLQGIGSAMMFVTGLAILTRVYPPMERGKVIGINTAAVYVGLSLGPVLGGALTHYIGWRSIFLVTLPITLLVILIISRVKEDWADAKGERFDLGGSISYSTFLFLLIYGFSILPDKTAYMLLIGSILIASLFVWIELNNSSPVFNLRLFKNFTFTFSSLAALINYSATFGVSLLLSYYLQYIKGLTPNITGFILVTQPVLMALVAPLAGRASDKFDPQKLAGLGMAVISTALFTLTFINASTPVSMIFISLIILGVGFGLFSSPNTNAIMSSVEKKYFGIASATVSTMRLIGQSFSIGIVTLIFAVILGRVRIIPANYHLLLKSTHVSFSIFAILCFIGIFAAIARRKE